VTTPFDHFMKAFTSWLETAWYLWVAMVVIFVVIVAVVVLSKVRARARQRVPQYRRQLPG
jgi:threonine/homoserine/homoserine lactone efflux protein